MSAPRPLGSPVGPSSTRTKDDGDGGDGEFQINFQLSRKSRAEIRVTHIRASEWVGGV